MRIALLAGSICLLTAGAAIAQTPQPPTAVYAPVAGGTTTEAVPCTTFVMPSQQYAPSGPRLWASGEYMLMWYTPMDTPPLIQAVPTAFVNSSDPAFTTTVYPENNRVSWGSFNGLRFNAGAGWDKYAVEAGMFALERKTQTGTLFTNGTPVAVAQGYIAAGSGIPTSLFASLAGEYSGGVNVIAESRLWGAEVNLRTSWYSFFSDTNDLIAGFRYLDLEESLFIDSPSTFPDGDVITVTDSIRTSNAFYGGQLGFNGRIGGFARGFGLDMTLKGAVGAVAQRAELVGSNTFITAGVPDVEQGGLYARGANFGTFTRNRIAYLQDVDIKLTYNFTRWVQVSFGYSLIYLSSVMRPGNAIDPVVNDNIRFVASPTPSNLNRPAFDWRAEELVVQGMTLGVRLQY